ncbi:MAG: histidine kinase [Reichenbachiella sp.]
MIKHPILDGNGYKIYAIAWVIVMIIHGLILQYNYNFSFVIAAADSLVYNLLFAAIANGIWYVVSFANLSKDETALFTTHTVSAFITILIWSTLSNAILNIIFINNEAYLSFDRDTLIWRMIIGLLYYGIVALIFYLIKYYQDMQERTHRELELQSLLKDAELRMLKSQINPHFIFNSLNSINALTLSKPESAREMVIKLSEFLRYSLGKETIEMNTLEQEIQNVSHYLDIEKVRFGNRLQFEKMVSEDCMKIKVPNLILQPLFENAIKYGVHDSIETITIQLNCQPNDDSLKISIINNFDNEALTAKGEGIGLENVRKRLSLVFGGSNLLEIKKQENQFEVIINIPLKDHE